MPRPLSVGLAIAVSIIMVAGALLIPVGPVLTSAASAGGATLVFTPPAVSGATILNPTSAICGTTLGPGATTFTKPAGTISCPSIAAYSNALTVGPTTTALNCNGWTIIGPGTSVSGTAGIGLSAGSTRVAVENCILTEFYYGILLTSSSSNTLIGNTANGNIGAGFALGSSSSNTLIDNTANGNGGVVGGFGILLLGSSNTLTGNTANDNGLVGFALGSSSSNTLIGNTANGNELGFVLDGMSNTLIGNRANDNTFEGFVLNGTYRSDNTLIENTANDNGGDGFLFLFLSPSCSSNTLIGNTAKGNGGDGFVFLGSSCNTLYGNPANGKGGVGFAPGRSATTTGPFVTKIEYGLIAALIAVVIIAGLETVGTALDGTFSYISGTI